MTIFLWALGVILGVIGYFGIGGIVSRLAWWAWPLKKGPRTVIRFLFFPMSVGSDLVLKTMNDRSISPLILSDYFEAGKRDEYVVASAWLWPLWLIWLPISCAEVSFEAMIVLLVLTAKHVAPRLMKAYQTLVNPSCLMKAYQALVTRLFRKKKPVSESPPLSSASRSLPAAVSVDLRVPRADEQKTSQPA